MRTVFYDTGNFNAGIKHDAVLEWNKRTSNFNYSFKNMCVKYFVDGHGNEPNLFIFYKCGNI